MFLRTPSLQASENSFGQVLIINLERISEKVFNLILRFFLLNWQTKEKFTTIPTQHYWPQPFIMNSQCLIDLNWIEYKILRSFDVTSFRICWRGPECCTCRRQTRALESDLSLPQRLCRWTWWELRGFPDWHLWFQLVRSGLPLSVGDWKQPWRQEIGLQAEIGGHGFLFVRRSEK